ncbi:MAG: hypothetical protein HY646_04110, partial [Acidobacteria bacterium]|nr:hypothetical protein [Acidobacteriota bacterium]
GSLFESHRNTVLNANTWFNNLRGDPRNVLIRNQFGGRLGGPIIKNRTFFHFLYDAQRQVTKNTVTNTVYTERARQGIFRYYPGVRNGNANAAVPTVDLNGTPVRPTTATGDLQELNVFGRDPNRMRADTTGIVARQLALTPLPNNFRSGDGLNVAGYTWSRRATNDRDQINIKIDHTFNAKHNAMFSFTREVEDNVNGHNAQAFPNSPGGKFATEDYFYSLGFVSTLSPRLVNELRAGSQRARIRAVASWDREEVLKELPTVGGLPYAIDLSGVTDPMPVPGGACCGYGYMAPLYNFSDNLTWVRGRHSFKGGVEVRFVSSAPFSAFEVMPRAIIGAGSVPVTGLNAAAIPTLGTNEGDAQSLLVNLSGSLSGVNQAFNSAPPPELDFRAYNNKIRHWQQRELSIFLKDDFKMRPNLTLNLGVRYEFYGVPYERRGQTAGIKGGSAGLFGLSGTGFGDMYRPFHQAGSLTEIELVGKNSPNPDTLIYNNDLNNFAPAMGLSWSMPYFGKDKTVLRLGYSIGYERNSLRMFNIVVGDQPGLRTVTAFRPATFLDLTRLSLPLSPAGRPLELGTALLTTRNETVRGFDTNLRTPYVQNWNLSITRQLPGNFNLDVRYVGNKGTKLIRGTNLNEVNIFETGILDAFRAIQAGGESNLLDRMFNGINLGSGVINGTTVRAGASLRNNNTTRALFANGNVGDFANYLNTQNLSVGTRALGAGGLLRNAGLPENYIVANPQFAGANYTGNFANSTYHSLQVDLTKRFSHGWMLQSNFTWSKALGEEEGSGQEMLDSYRNGRDRKFDKRLLSFDRKFVFRNSGTFELPFGPGKVLFRESSGILARIVERWQIAPIFNLFSGAPFSFSSGVSSFNQLGDNTPTVVSDVPVTGRVTRVANGVVFFPDLRQAPDPAIQSLTTAQALNTRSTLLAIADSSGRLIMVNPRPGELGNLAPLYARGPISWRFDVNLVKRIRLGEQKEFELRADAIDVLNSPQFGNPDAAISSTTFGRITGAGGNRIVVLGARLNF